MKKIAITGSIACGKSTLLFALKKKGFPVFDCDSEIKKLYEKKDILQKIKNIVPIAFDGEVFKKDKLLEVILQNRKFLKKLEGILYPSLYKNIENFAKYHRSKNRKIIFFEIPLLFEKGIDKMFDDVILLSSNERRRRNNFLRKGGKIEVFKFLNSLQWNDIKKKAVAQQKGYHILYLHSVKTLEHNVNVLLKNLTF